MATVLVTKRSALDEKGNVFLEAATPQVYEITHYYGQGRVKVASGDVWTVKPYKNPQVADFISMY